MSASEDGLDSERRRRIFEACRVPDLLVEPRHYVGQYLILQGPYGPEYFDIEGPAGQELAAYIGMPGWTLTNFEPTRNNGLAPRKSINDTGWNRAVAVLRETLWESYHQRKAEQAACELAQRRASERAASWIAPEISLLTPHFVRYLKQVEASSPCPRCRNAPIPFDPDKGFVYCRHCAQGYELSSADILAEKKPIGLRPLHYDCPGCGHLVGLSTATAVRDGICRVCGVKAIVGSGGLAAYADRAQERRDSGKGIHKDKNRLEQLARWRIQSSGRVAEATRGLEQRYLEWKSELQKAVLQIQLEDSIAWTLHGSELLQLRSYDFERVSESELPRLREDTRNQRAEELEKELREQYPWGPMLDEELALRKQYPWAHKIIESLHHPPS